ncbi:c-type cytochrome [Polaribacter sp. L3A8]|uniref:c-type cytochrome n=1 Tax=Polaribacter sp. L3A8 TaxID=2686361 RepID=UPI00131CE123|nr:c-type cytochrome [Polaribacter sp. L3A8]
MKKIILSPIALFFVLSSFTLKKETITHTKSSLENGKKLFNSKTCSACHQEKVKVVGPSLKDIAAKYKAKKGSIVLFLQGKAKPIVETDTGQTAIMQTSLSITKTMKVEDLKDISEYIMNIK